MLKLSTPKDIWIPVNLNTGTIKPTMTAVVTGGSKDSKNTHSIPVSALCLQQNSRIHQKIQTENIFQSNMKTQLSQEIDKVFQQDKQNFPQEINYTFPLKLEPDRWARTHCMCRGPIKHPPCPR